MTTQLTNRLEAERRQTLAQIAILDIARHLIRAGASHLDAASTWAAIGAEAARRAEQRGAFAVAEGESYAAVARAMGISRQAAAKKFGAPSRVARV